jgi:hypothetical protein
VSRRPPRPRLPWTNPSITVALAVVLVLALGVVGIAVVVGPLGADGDVAGGGGPRQTELRAATERGDGGIRVTITGRVRPSEAPGGAVVQLLARPDDADPCPLPRVREDGTIALPAGDSAVRWRPAVGPSPGQRLPAGEPIRMLGDVTTPGVAARVLCVHLVRGGADPVVLRSLSVATPDASSSGAGLRTQLQEDALVLTIIVVMVVAIVAGALAIVVLEARRRGRTWSLPALPPDVRIPDVVPSDDPQAGISRPRAWLRRTGERRLERWRTRRRAETAEAGELFDPYERPPWSVRVWGVGDGAGRIAAERFRALRDLHPDVETLHDRRIPGPRGATVDHLLVGPAGVVVASSSRWDGFVEVVGDRLLVDGRNRTRAIDGVTGRVTAVRAILAAAGFAGVPVRGVLHCVVTEDVLLTGALELRDIPLLDALGTLGRAVDPPVLSYEGVRAVRVALERRLPAA